MMENEHYQLLKDHIDLRFDALRTELKAKKKEDIRKEDVIEEKIKTLDGKINKTERRVFYIAVAISLLLDAPKAISFLVKGLN